MTDRELLELAAKAAGIGFDEDIIVLNPLTDDGDALRLAVKCGIGVIVDKTFVNVYRCGLGKPVVDLCEHYEEHDGNQFAATRRAIVRAAAAIGETLP